MWRPAHADGGSPGARSRRRRRYGGVRRDGIASRGRHLAPRVTIRVAAPAPPRPWSYTADCSDADRVITTRPPSRLHEQRWLTYARCIDSGRAGSTDGLDASREEPCPALPFTTRARPDSAPPMRSQVGLSDVVSWRPMSDALAPGGRAQGRRAPGNSPSDGPCRCSRRACRPSRDPGRPSALWNGLA